MDNYYLIIILVKQRERELQECLQRYWWDETYSAKRRQNRLQMVLNLFGIHA